MSDASGSTPQKDEGNGSGPGSPVSERNKQFEKQAQEEKRQMKTTLQKKVRRLDAEEVRNKELEAELARANQEKEAAIKETKEVISSKPTMTLREKEHFAHLQRTVELLESQAHEHEATLTKSMRLEGQVKWLETQLHKAKEEIEEQKEKVLHEQQTSRDYQKMLAVANKKTPEIERKYDSLADLFDQRAEEFNNKEKQFEKRIKALQRKYDVQVEQNKTLDAEKKQAEILNANLETQVETLTGNLREAEAEVEQNHRDVRDFIEKAQSTRESSPSSTGGGGGGGGGGEPGQSLRAELSDAASSQGSVVSIEDQAHDFAAKALEELQQKASSLEADNTKLRGEMAGLQKEVSVLKEERDGLQKKLSALQGENDELEKRNEDLTGERDGLQTKTSGLERRNNKLQDEVADLKKEAIDLNAEKDGLQKKASELTNGASKLESELHAEKDRLQEQISQLQEENAGLQKRVSELGSEAGKLEGELKAGNDMLQKQVTDLQAENDQLRKSTAELADDASKLHAESRAEKEKLWEEVSALQQQNEELRQKASGLTSGTSKLKDDLAETTEALRRAKEDQDRFQRLQDQRDEELTAANGQLEAELGQARQDANQHQATIAELEAEKRNMQAQMANSQEIYNRIGALQEERDKLQRELQNELDAKKKALDQVAKAQDQESSEGGSDSYEKVVSDLLQSKADLAGQIRTMEESRKSILDELEAVKQKLAAAPSSEDVQKLRNRLQELRKERKQLVADLARLEKEKGEIEDRLAERDALPSNEYLKELRQEMTLANEARERAEKERDDQMDQLMAVMGEKLDVEAKIQALERARDAQPAQEDLEEAQAQLDAAKTTIEELHAQLDDSKARQDDYQKRYQELLDDERAVELDLSKVRDAANSARTADLDPANALRERIAALNARLDEARQERDDAGREAPVGEPAEERGQASNPMVEQLERQLAEGMQTQARQEAALARRKEKKRREKGKYRAGEPPEPILDETESGEDGGGGGDGPSGLDRKRQLRQANEDMGREIRQLKRDNRSLETAVQGELAVIDGKKRQIADLQRLVTAQPQPAGPPPGDDVLAGLRAGVPEAVRARNRGVGAAFAAALRDVRALLAAAGVPELRAVAAQPRVVLCALYAAVFALLGMVLAEGHRYHQWAVANDVSRAMYVNRNWYVAVVLPDMRPWEQVADLFNQSRG